MAFVMAEGRDWDGEREGEWKREKNRNRPKRGKKGRSKKRGGR